MKGRRRAWWCLLVFALVCPAAGGAQTVYGTLLERGTDRPIDLALVMLLTAEGDSVLTVLSDSTGAFRLAAPEAGDYRLAAAAMGYKPTVSAQVLSLPAGTAVTLQFRLTAQPIEIAGVTVDALASKVSAPRLIQNGFVERVQAGFGSFIAPFQIEQSPAPSTSDLLARTGKVITRYALGGDQILMMGSRGYCVPVVYLDGLRMNMSDMSIDMMAPKFDLEAVEIYRSTMQAPAKYSGGSMESCGVIVLWSKVGRR